MNGKNPKATMPKSVRSALANFTESAVKDHDPDYVAGYYSGLDDAFCMALNQVNVFAALSYKMIDDECYISASDMEVRFNEMLAWGRKDKAFFACTTRQSEVVK